MTFNHKGPMCQEQYVRRTQRKGLLEHSLFRISRDSALPPPSLRFSDFCLGNIPRAQCTHPANVARTTRTARAKWADCSHLAPYLAPAVSELLNRPFISSPWGSALAAAERGDGGLVAAHAANGGTN